RLLADGGGQPERQLGTRAATDGDQHTSNRDGVRSDERDIAGRIDQQVLDGIDPEAVLAGRLRSGFEHEQIGVGLQHRLANALRGDVRDPDLAAQLPWAAFRVACDAGEQGAIGAGHFDALAERALGRHLDDAEQGAARILGIEEGRDGFEQWARPRRIGRGDQDAVVAHVRAVSKGSILSVMMWSQAKEPSTRRRSRAGDVSTARSTAAVKARAPDEMAMKNGPSWATSRNAGRSVHTTGTRKRAASASGRPKPSLALGRITTSLSI